MSGRKVEASLFSLFSRKVHINISGKKVQASLYERKVLVSLSGRKVDVGLS